ncbi:MAG: phosphate acyltransferase [Wenzhouxiangella sp.]
MNGSEKLRVAVDALGGDGRLARNLAAIRFALEADAELQVLACGPAAEIAPIRDAWPQALRDRLVVCNAEVGLAADAGPGQALRRGRESSMGEALRSVVDHAADAVVSGGSTGALMVLARHLLGTWPGVDRPALMGALPTGRGSCWMLDMGANLQVDARRLHEFARLGRIAVSLLNGREPVIGLLNVGTEPGKGPDLVREAGRLISGDEDLDYGGFVEADQVFAGQVDLVVCDGFSGNILLKSAEGAVALMFEQMRNLLGGSLCGWLAKPRLSRLRDSLDPARHNGAALLGVRGVVIKSHGGASMEGVAHAIALAAREARGGLSQAMESQFRAVD